jgi:hypothetical protein
MKRSPPEGVTTSGIAEGEMNFRSSILRLVQGYSGPGGGRPARHFSYWPVLFSNRSKWFWVGISERNLGSRWLGDWRFIHAS